jgi:transcriptional regulator of NAD metabolism
MDALDAYFEEQNQGHGEPEFSTAQLLQIERQERKKLSLRVESLEKELQQLRQIIIQHFGVADSKVEYY